MFRSSQATYQLGDLGKSITSGPQLPPLENGSDKSASFIGVWGKLNELMHVKGLGQDLACVGLSTQIVTCAEIAPGFAKLKDQGQHGSIPSISLARKGKKIQSAGTAKPSEPGIRAGLAGRESIQKTLFKEDSGSSKQQRGRLVSCPFSLRPVV